MPRVAVLDLAETPTKHPTAASPCIRAAHFAIAAHRQDIGHNHETFRAASSAPSIVDLKQLRTLKGHREAVGDSGQSRT